MSGSSSLDLMSLCSKWQGHIQWVILQMAGGDICALLYAKPFYWDVQFSYISWSVLALSASSPGGRVIKRDFKWIQRYNTHPKMLTCAFEHNYRKFLETIIFLPMSMLGLIWCYSLCIICGLFLFIKAGVMSWFCCWTKEKITLQRKKL